MLLQMMAHLNLSIIFHKVLRKVFIALLIKKSPAKAEDFLKQFSNF